MRVAQDEMGLSFSWAGGSGLRVYVSLTGGLPGTQPWFDGFRNGLEQHGLNWIEGGLVVAADAESNPGSEVTYWCGDFPNRGEAATAFTMLLFAVGLDDPAREDLVEVQVSKQRRLS